MRISQHTTLLFTLFGTIAAHGNVTSPPARLPGPAMEAACGADAIAAVLADGTTPLENVPVPAGATACQLDLCRGAKFEDNTARVQTFTAGDVIPITADLPIPHFGPMNVSIVDTASNALLTQPLVFDPNYADERLAALPANNSAFSVTMPDLGARCAVPGECTMQWFWFGTGAQQTYESCVDFVMAPAGGVAAAAGTVGTAGTAGTTAKSAKAAAKKSRKVETKFRA